MGRNLRKFLSVLLVIIVLLTSAPIAGLADIDIFDNLDIFSVKASAATSNCFVNSSYDPASAGADKSNLPSGCKTFYYKESPYLNISVGDEVFIHDAYIYLYRNDSLYQTYHLRDQFPNGNYFRYWANPVNDIDVGSYRFYFVIIYSSYSASNSKDTYTSMEYTFTVIDRTPSLNLSTTSVSFDLASKEYETVDIGVSCELSYKWDLFVSENSDALMCWWGVRENGNYPVMIMATDTCSSEVVTVKLKRISDNTVIASKEIYVTVTKPSYTISYDANGGFGAPSPQTKQYDETLKLSNNVPIKTGCTFLGWSTSSTATTATYLPGADYTSNSGATLYAVWRTEIKPTGSISSTNNVATTQTVTLTLSDAVGVAGYYWGTSSTYTNNSYTSTSSTSVTKTISEPGMYYLTVKNTSGNVSPSYGVIFYKTTLNANNGSVSPSYVITKKGSSFTFPTATRSGYTCKGWATSSTETSGVTTLTPTSNATYYALWDSTDTVKPTGSITSTNNVAASQTVTLSLSDNVGVAGYYWGTSSTYSSNTYTSTSKSSVTLEVNAAGTYYLTVKDTKGNLSENYSITFYKTTLNANGGSVSPTSVLTKSGNTFTFPTATKSGYTYGGWATSSSATSGVTTLKPTSNATYYAVWSYVDTVKPTGSITSTNNVAVSQTVTLTLSDNVGVAGYYWGTSSTYSSNNYTSTSSSSVIKTVDSAGTYYLTVKDTKGNLSENYSITFYKTTLNANGGSVSPTSVLTKSGNTFTFPSATKSSYTYGGWATSSSATSGVTTLKPTSNATYYAVWTYNDSTKPTGSISSTNNVAATQTVTLSLSDNVGVAGYYWGTNSTYSSNTYTSTSKSSVTLEVNAAGTYYLTVKDTSGNVSEKYSVTFYKTTLNANGGSVSPTSVLTKSGNTFTFPSATKSSYTYGGWATSSSATSGVTTLKPTSNATYYAVWSYVDTVKPTGSISSTNNVAASQTVTLTLSDNVGVAGYYWGTSSTYSSNNYTSTSSSSVTKTIDSAGTYYLTVKDTSGNLSSNYSITFYKTTLNANEGSVTPSYVITKSGNSFTLPTATRSGYTFNGWVTISTSTNVVTTLKPTSNATYYALWTAIDTTKPTGSISSTNNVATSQTVTLSFSDNVGVEGYYWGTSSNYSGNSFTSTSKSSATVTVSSAGTYYLNVMDTSGNLSEKYSITFCKTTLNANGGSVSPSYVLTKSGNTFTFPTATRSGYICKGWGTSSTASSYVTALKPTSNATYYALWRSPEILKKTEIFSFANNATDFFGSSTATGKYYVSDSDFNRLSDCIRAHYGNNKIRANSVISSCNTFRNSDWEGSCYGMALTTLLDKSNKIAFNENFSAGATSMSEVQKPYLNSKVKSAINYYVVSQRIGFLMDRYETFSVVSGQKNSGFADLISMAKQDQLIMFTYTYEEYDAKKNDYVTYGHAVVLKEYNTDSNGNHILVAYDNRYPQDSYYAYLKVDSQYKKGEFIVEYNNSVILREALMDVQYISDMSVFDVIDIDGTNNNVSSRSLYNTDGQQEKTELYFTGDDNFTVYNESGEHITISGNQVEGDMTVYSKRFIVNGDGENGNVTYVLSVDDSKSFSFESDNGNLNVGVLSDEIYAETQSTNADGVVITKDEGVHFFGENAEFKLSLTCKIENIDSITLAGSCDESVMIGYSADGIIANGVSGEYDLEIYYPDKQEEKIVFDTNFSDILISSTVGSVGETTVLGSSTGEIFDVFVPSWESCQCICHNSDLPQIIWRVYSFICKFFASNKVCGCGINHY